MKNIPTISNLFEKQANSKAKQRKSSASKAIKMTAELIEVVEQKLTPQVAAAKQSSHEVAMQPCLVIAWMLI